jgi:hypothetical protein
MDVQGFSFEVRFEFKTLCSYYEFWFHVYAIISMYYLSGNSKTLNTENSWSEITELGLKSGYQNCVWNPEKLREFHILKSFLLVVKMCCVFDAVKQNCDYIPLF